MIIWLAVAALLAIVLAMTAVSAIVGRRTPPLRIGWCTGVVGDRGSGKSLFVARLISQRLEAGVNVVTNFGVPGCQRLVDWEDAIMAPAGSMVVIDEAHQWAASEGSAALAVAPRWYLAHVRKLDHEVWWIAQDEMQVHAGVRRLTNEYTECRKVWRGVHRASCYTRRLFRTKNAKAIWTWTYTPSGAAIRVFDTSEFIRPTDQSANRSNAEWIQRINDLIDILIERRTVAAEHFDRPT